MIPLGEWLPDRPALENPGALEALNVIPRAGGYGPLKSLLPSGGGAGAARLQGAASFRSTDLSVKNFCGAATALYKFDGTAWSDVSRTAGGAYGCPAEGMWRFAQFGDLAIAVNGVDAPQKFVMASGTAFTALGGSPPLARHVATVRDFVVMARDPSFTNRVQWSGINDAESWTPSAATQADQQDLPDGGQIMGLVGGEYGLVFQEHAIRRMTYVGSPLVFQIDKIAIDKGALCEYSIAAHERRAFFVAHDGIYMLAAGQELVPIGAEKVDRTFLADLNASYLHRVTGAIDPIAKLYVLSYPSRDSADGTPDRLLIYNWQLQRWARGLVACDFVYSAFSQSVWHSDNIDALLGHSDATLYSGDSALFAGSGVQALAAFTTDHKLGFFEGPSLGATVDTTEAQVTPGRRSFVTGARPRVDGAATVSMRIGTRNLTTADPVWSGAVAMNGEGLCPFRASAVFHRGRIEIAAGGSWSCIQGLEVEARAEGVR
ncbi:MAG: hypothetical protein ACOY3L_03670 [Pseudomonadota bacterium]